MYAAGEHILLVAKRYPPKKRPSRREVYGTPWKTERQRKFMMMAMRTGLIEVPYRRQQSSRSRRFKQQWSHTFQPDGLVHVIGNNVREYGPYLMDPKLRSLYAAAVGWKTTAEIATSERDKCVRIVTRALMDAFTQGG